MQLCKTNKVLRFSIPKYDSVSNYYKMFKEGQDKQQTILTIKVTKLAQWF